MKLSVMQPYLFPYIGYFHLIEATDKIIFYDDVSFIKRGWINRNNILINAKDYLFTVPLEKPSQNKLINEIPVLNDEQFTKTFFKQIQNAYQKAPFYKEVNEIIEHFFSKEYNNIADMAIASICMVYQYLDKELIWDKSSVFSPETKGMEKADRLIQLSKKANCNHYINLKGGIELYDKSYFEKRGVTLNFTESILKEYTQFNHNFIPWLSILDVLMFCEKEEVLDQFKSFKLI